MDDKEQIDLEKRLAVYRSAKQSIARYEKLARTLSAILKDKDHSIEAIVIDTREKEFRYAEEKIRGRTICALNDRAEHKEIFDQVVLGMANIVKKKMDAAKERMKDA